MEEARLLLPQLDEHLRRAARAFFERGKFGMTVGGVWNQPEWTQHKFTDYSLVTLPSPTATPKGYYYADPVGNGPSSRSPPRRKNADEAFRGSTGCTPGRRHAAG